MTTRMGLEKPLRGWLWCLKEQSKATCEVLFVSRGAEKGDPRRQLLNVIKLFMEGLCRVSCVSVEVSSSPTSQILLAMNGGSAKS